MSLISLSTWLDESRGSSWATFIFCTFLPEHSFMLKSWGWWWWGGGPCDYCVSPSPNNWVLVFFWLCLNIGLGLGTCWDRDWGLKYITRLSGYIIFLRCKYVENIFKVVVAWESMTRQWVMKSRNTATSHVTWTMSLLSSVSGCPPSVCPPPPRWPLSVYRRGIMQIF